MAYGRRRRFGFGGRRTSSPVTSHTGAARKRGRCVACRSYFEKGDQIITLKLKKRYALLACGHTLKRSKKFHTGCVPQDIITAMGYDPAKAGQYVPPPPPSAQHNVAPPPKPASHEDLALSALLAVENAIKARAKAVKTIDPVQYKEIAEKFKTFQGIKARALRPGTEHEGTTAMKLALRKGLDIVF